MDRIDSRIGTARPSGVVAVTTAGRRFNDYDSSFTRSGIVANDTAPSLATAGFDPGSASIRVGAVFAGADHSCSVTPWCYSPTAAAWLPLSAAVSLGAATAREVVVEGIDYRSVFLQVTSLAGTGTPEVALYVAVSGDQR